MVKISFVFFALRNQIRLFFLFLLHDEHFVVLVDEKMFYFIIDQMKKKQKLILQICDMQMKFELITQSNHKYTLIFDLLLPWRKLIVDTDRRQRMKRDLIYYSEKNEGKKWKAFVFFSDQKLRKSKRFDL